MCRFFVFVLFSFSFLVSKAQRVVLPGDYPDPSAVKIGNTWWASATTSNWMPAYPLLKSTDLVNWQTVGAIFPTLPAWADYYFWAPEMTYENGRVYVYYAAHKKGGNLCVGVASAADPEGPYTDHGPLVCEAAGSIDAFPIRDESGKLHLVWKEDGNSIGKPTPIWIQEMNEARTALLGTRKELFRNDAPWEGNLVEGVSMIKRGDYLYAFYAAAGCCGTGCTYNTGVARAKSLMGPWEKYAGNPIIKNEGALKCPGHGTPVEQDGRYYFLYHAYDTAGSVYTGRQGVLKEFNFTADGWPRFLNETAPAVPVIPDIADKFGGRHLSHEWQWNVFQPAQARVRGGRLELAALPGVGGAFLAQKTYAPAYTATVVVNRKKSDAVAGIALIGDEKNLIAARLNGSVAEVVQLKDGKDTVLYSQPVSRGRKGQLRLQVRNGKDLFFFYSANGRNFVPLNPAAINGAYLPPWDRALRVGILSKGEAGQKAVVDAFEVDY